MQTIYTDFSKPFDGASPSLLVQKSYILCGEMLNWLSSYLVNGEQWIVLDGTYSEWTTVPLGVPQGSILGQIMFLLFVNDLPHQFLNSQTYFSDDLKAFKTVSCLNVFLPSSCHFLLRKNHILTDCKILL